MTKIEVKNIPENRGNPEWDFKISKMIEDRNISISKRFEMSPKDITAKIYFSTASMRFAIDPNGEGMGVYAGYVDQTNEIHLANPEIIRPVFGDNLDKEILTLIDYSLIKMYMCFKYYPDSFSFKTYYKYVTETLASLSSGKFKPDIVKFEIKNFSEDKRYRKEQEIAMIFHIMYEKSGIDFIYSHLNKIMEDCDIRKSIFSIYKKSFSEMITQYQRELREIDKKTLDLKKGNRR